MLLLCIFIVNQSFVWLIYLPLQTTPSYLRLGQFFCSFEAILHSKRVVLIRAAIEHLRLYLECNYNTNAQDLLICKCEEHYNYLYMNFKLQVQNMICTANVSEDNDSIFKDQMYTRAMAFFGNIVLYFSVFL